MPGLLKFRIGVVTEVLVGGQIRRRDVIDEPAGRGIPLVALHQIGDVRRGDHVGDHVTVKARFDTVQSQGRQNQQPRSQRNEQQ